MKKIALISVIALSALMVGCSSTETRSDSDSMGEMKACEMKKADGKACKMEGKMDAKACAKCKEMKDGKMCAKCADMKAKMGDKACKMKGKMDCKMKGKMDAKACAKCEKMKDGKMCAKCEAKKAAMKDSMKDAG